MGFNSAFKGLRIQKYVSKPLAAIAAQILTATLPYEISGFRRELDKDCALLSYYAACTGS